MARSTRSEPFPPPWPRVPTPAHAGLPNRNLFHDRMRSALVRVQRDSGQLSLLYIDLDRFQDINGQFGHSTGDHLLQQVLRRLAECVRGTDTIARFGGDAFVMLLELSAEF